MNPNDAPRFKELLTGVYSYYRIELSQFHIDVFWQALKSFDFGAVQDAFSRHVQNPDNGQFLPKVADIVKLIGGGTADRALLAWSKFEIAVQYVGSWDSVVFDDPIIHQVADDMGGWTDLCAREEKEWPFVKNEFVQRYRGYANSRLLSYPSKLVGRIEAENGGRWPDACRRRSSSATRRARAGDAERRQRRGAPHEEDRRAGRPSNQGFAASVNATWTAHAPCCPCSLAAGCSTARSRRRASSSCAARTSCGAATCAASACRVECSPA
jgi:hypothetical protein